MFVWLRVEYYQSGGISHCVLLSMIQSWMRLDTTNFILSVGSQVKMTTGATIHTAAGLHMSVVKRTKPPIIPELDSLSPNGSSKAPQTGSDSAPSPQISVR